MFTLSSYCSSPPLPPPPARLFTMTQDPEDNLLVQLSGYKTLLLLPPSAAAVLGPGPKDHLLRNTRGGLTFFDRDTSDCAVKGASGHEQQLLQGQGRRLWLSSPSACPDLASYALSTTAAAASTAAAATTASLLWSLPGLEGAVVAELGPGEAAYIPKGWWHYVAAAGPLLAGGALKQGKGEVEDVWRDAVVSVNFWWSLSSDDR